MIDPEPVPRRNLFTNGDAEAWETQFHLLCYVLHMSPTQIAQIDYGLDPDHPDAFAVFSWARDTRDFPEDRRRGDDRGRPLTQIQSTRRPPAGAW